MKKKKKKKQQLKGLEAGFVKKETYILSFFNDNG